ncbi:MAG TPA: flagellar biosynthetic protein FliR [Candidatus Sulfotelmatobacter sp.]|jgi:flagellar biosynthetic protein FliR|nr:flagellar biosynthetic protein FliR [Candidatus Sulfotelmatobacter sp.]
MLREILTVDVFKLLLIVARLGTAIMFAPGLGGTLVSSRTRLLLSFLLSFLLMPVLDPMLPAMPVDPMGMTVLVLGEATVGLFFGVLMQLLMAPIDLAGNFVSYATGLTNAYVYDTLSQDQSQIVTSFINNVALTLFLMTDTHHVMLRALVDSYGLFQPGAPLPMEDFSQTLVKVSSESFAIAMRLAAPLIVFSLVFNVALGLMNKLVPQMQVFFVGTPLQLLIGMFILMIALPPMMMIFIRYMNDGLIPYLSPGG